MQVEGDKGRVTYLPPERSLTQWTEKVSGTNK